MIDDTNKNFNQNDDDAQVRTDEMQTGDDLASSALASVSGNVSAPRSGAQGEDAGMALISLQNIIERNANELDRIKEEMKVQRQSLKNVFENDTELAVAEEQVAQFTQQVKEKKSRLQTSPQVTQLKTKIGELNEQKKEIEEALNNHLLNLYQMTGSKTFDTSTGEQREFNIRASIKGGKKGGQEE